MRSLFCFIVFLALLSGSTSSAQSWLTDWEALSEDGQTPLTGERADHAEFFVDMLEEASGWFASMGFKAPDMERSPTNPGAYLARVKDDPDDVVSYLSYGNDPSPESWMYLTGDLDMTNPQTGWERLFWASPVHELMHGSMWSYQDFEAYAFHYLQPKPRLPRCPPSSDATLIGWFDEGASSVLQIRWFEREQGGTYGHPFTHPGTAAWVRHFDQPIYEGHVPPPFENPDSPVYQGERNEGRSWRCGYGTWPFWYFVGNQLAKEPGQEVEYLRYILEQPSGWENGALEAVDAGLQAAAAAFDSPNRVNDGLFELYPAFIAEYADTTAFYEHPGTIVLLGGSQLEGRSNVLDPLSTDVWEVHIEVPDDLGEGSVPFWVTVESDEERDQLHLIEGQRVFDQPSADADPYQFEIPLSRDTTLLVRLANVAIDAAATEEALYTIRFEVGGFYGETTAGDVPSVDIPPGFSVMSGPPELIGCSGGPEAGSEFDLVTRAEAVGDIRRAEDTANETLDSMEESLEDEEFPLPNATPAQREGMRRAIERGDVSEAQMAEMRAAIQESRNMMEEQAPDIEDVRSEMAEKFRSRSRLLATFVGQVGNKRCLIRLSAVLNGEEGGAQQVSVADSEDYESDGPMPVGIEGVGFLVGSVPEILEQEGEENRFRVCMMTPREREREQERSCAVVCSGGQLGLEEASQGHAKGTLRVDMIRRDSDQRDAAGCPIVHRRELVVGFNITSANQGQDADPLRGYSIETLLEMGFELEEYIDSQEIID